MAVNLATRMVKTTSLTVLIGVVEVLKAGQQIIEANRYTVPDFSNLDIWMHIFPLFSRMLAGFQACGEDGKDFKPWIESVQH